MKNLVVVRKVKVDLWAVDLWASIDGKTFGDVIDTLSEMVGPVEQGEEVRVFVGNQIGELSVVVYRPKTFVELRDQVLGQIVQDVQTGDLTALEDLLVYCEEKAMQQYLPVGEWYNCEEKAMQRPINVKTEREKK